jgi:2-desacetyl-2-hydroxyethyl bacteriochlorophyllide A dehydrogenase
MRAIVLDKPGKFSMVETDPPEKPKPGEATVAVKCVGICGTDLHAFQGEQPFFNYPRIVGHEFAVEIVAVEENARGLAVGDRCTSEPYIQCGSCIACRRGKTNCCVNLKLLGVHIDGAMRERINVPLSNLHKSDKLPLDQLAIVEMLSVGAHAVRRAAPERREPTLVVGTGPIGLSVATIAREAGAEVIVMDISERRLEFCRNVLHFHRAVDARADPLAQLQQLCGGELPTLVLDCTGSRGSMMNSFNYVAHGGRLVFVGLIPGDLSFHDPYFHAHEMTIMSSRNATTADFLHVLELLESGKIDVAPWITHRVSSMGMVDVFPQWTKPETGVLKAVVEW